MRLSWQRGAAIFVAILLWNSVTSDQIIPGHPGVSFVPSSREPKFTIEFHSDDMDFQFHPGDDHESMVMQNKNGDKFHCYLPKVEKTKSSKSPSQQNVSGIVVESETQIKSKTPDELLDSMKDLCFIRQEGWWSYEFCYKNHLRQIHLEDGKPVQDFFLGKYNAEATEAYHKNLSNVSTLKDLSSKDASQRYHVHIFDNGTICDLTNEPRETEVRFVCSEPRTMISSITELSTCKYALTFQSPFLCKHPSFQDERPASHTIHCFSLPQKETEKMPQSSSSEGEKTTVLATGLSYRFKDHPAT